MAFSVSSPSSSLASEIFTPVEEQLSFPFDWHHFLANYLRLLGLDSKAIHKQYHVNIDQDTFKTPNIKGFQIVAHFLLTKLDGERAKKTFLEVWPVHDKKQEAGFRRKVQEWCTEIQSNNKEFFPHINPSIFMHEPGGKKFARILCHLACHVIGKTPQRSEFLAPPIVFHGKLSSNEQPSNKASGGFAQNFQHNFMKGTLGLKQKKWRDIYERFGQKYSSGKCQAKKWVEMYREHCRKLEEDKDKINKVINQSSLSHSQKLGILDERENQRTCSDLVSSIESKQMNINQMVENILVFKKPFLDAQEVVDFVLENKNAPTTINGRELVSSVPRDDIDRYQNLHSGTRLELQLRNGCYDFLPVLNLMLLAVPTIAEVSKRLNFPSLTNEVMKLNQLEESVRAGTPLAKQIHQKWITMNEKQKANIARLIQSKIKRDVPMALQPYTPLRNVLAIDNGNSVEYTPTALRAVLGAITPVELGAKPKTRPSVNSSTNNNPELLLNRRDNKTTVANAINGRQGNLLNDRRRRSNEAELLCRQNSLTPDPSSRHSSFSRTPVGVSGRMGRPGSSSLAASPILETVMMSEGPASGGSPITLKQKKRRSLQQQVLTTRSAVLDRAADALAFDLDSFKSSASANQVALVDPNNSIEKRGFLTRNLIGRSPPDEEKNGNSNGGNLELLRVLTSKFASPIASSSRAPSTNNSPSFTRWMNENVESIPNFDYGYREEGLLDASHASLIDDIYDFLD